MALLRLVEFAMQEAARVAIKQVASPLPLSVRPFRHLESLIPLNCQLTATISRSGVVGRFGLAILQFTRLAIQQFHSCLMTEFKAVPFLSLKQMRFIQFRMSLLPTLIANFLDLSDSLRLGQYFEH